MARAVAGRGDHDTTCFDDGSHRVAVGRAAGTCAAQAQVEHARRGGVGRNTRNAQPGRPAHAGDDVRVEAAALAQHAHRQHAHRAAHAGHAHAVVGQGADQAGGLRAMPRAGFGPAGAALERAADLVDVGLRDPVAGVRRIGVTPAAVVGHIHVADHVVTRQQVAAGTHPQQVGVVEANAAVQHGHHHAGRTGADAPCGFHVDRRFHLARGRAQIPLAHRRAVAAGCQIQGIAGCGEAVASLVWHGVLNVAFLGQPRRQLLRCHAAGEHHLCALGHARAGAQRQPGAQAQRLRLRGVLFGDGERLLAQHRRVGLELHDHTRRWRAVGNDFGNDFGRSRQNLRRVQRQRGQQRTGGGEGEQRVAHGRTPEGQAGAEHEAPRTVTQFRRAGAALRRRAAPGCR